MINPFNLLKIWDNISIKLTNQREVLSSSRNLSIGLALIATPISKENNAYPMENIVQ